jgi:hypothetical protein
MAKESTKVITGKVRLNFVHVFEPYSVDPEDEPKFSCLILVPKSDKATITALRRAQKAALENGKERVFGGKIPSNWADTIHDGDEREDLETYPEYAGHLYLSVSSKERPGVVDRNVQPILDSTEIYSGCYGRVSLGAFAYNTKGNKGVSFGLNHIQKLADGEMLGGRTRAEDDFDAVPDDDEDDTLI